MNEAPVVGNLSLEALVGRVADEFINRLDKGEQPSIEEYAGRYPEASSVLREVLQALQLVRVSGPPPGATSAGACLSDGLLGDFRIVREVGRGGMGIVYEAEQISLRRRVALKALPLAAMMDPRHLQRFHNEAQAAACLHHTNIVPVFFVGCERGVHFYAMQFIDGQPLSEIIRQLQRAEKKAPTAGEAGSVAFQPSGVEAASTPSPAAAITPLTGEGRRNRDYYRKVAELGIQAAEALDHAHQLGIVHRDIKPANLMLDGRGNLWVTDFGLAHMQHGEASLTMTGQALGTPRYMSPEQAMAKRVPIDHRTDVYSLGVTLYELLTLRPAFASEDRQELLRQIALEEPAKPRRLERAVPAELETIVLKAMEKRPQDRYATAQELADDLSHWLEERPIRARRPSWVQVGRKWARRHQAVVWSALVLLLVLLVLGLGNAMWWLKKQTEAQTEARAALQEAQEWQKVEKWSVALSALRRARGALRGFGSDASLRQQVDELYKDLEMAQRLEEARLQSAAVQDGHFDIKASISAYEAAFVWYGLDVEHEDTLAMAEFIRTRSISMQLVAALDHWASLQRLMKDQEWKHLLAVARAADTDDWRHRFRIAWERGDDKTLNDLLDSAEVDKLLPTTIQSILGFSHPEHKNVSVERAAALLRRAQQRQPADFWINHDLAVLLHHAQPPQLEDAIGYLRAAVALRPQSPGVHNNFGNALRDKGRLDEAIAEYREAIRLNKDFAEAHQNLGTALADHGQLDEAIAEYREAIRLKKDYAEAHCNLGTAQRKKGQLNEAIAEYHEALQIKMDDAEPHYNLGVALADQGQLDEAIAEYREAIRLNKDFAGAHNNLGTALHNKGQLDEAIAEYREAIRLNKDFAGAHTNLGTALADKGQLDEAIAEYRQAIRLNKDFATAHYNLGNSLSKKGQLDEAIAEYREAIRLKKDFAEARCNLGTTLRDKGQVDEAIAEYREAIRLNKDFAEARCNLGTALRKKGQLDEAIAEYREAIRLNKDFAEAHNNLGVALADQGQLDEAIAEYGEAIRLNKDYAEAHNNLGTALHNKGQLDEAIAEFFEAIRLNKDYVDAHYNLGRSLADQGQLDEAIAEYREAIRLNKDFAEAHCNLGGLLEKIGRFSEALAYRQRGHEIGSKNPRWPYPSAQWVRNCERLVELDDKLPAILSGQKQPADSAECLALAQFCQLPCKRQNLAAKRFYSQAFAEKPSLADDLDSPHRYNAACAAALAGCGQGADTDKLDAKERARLRQQALAWLRADLRAYRQLMENSAGKAGPRIAQRMPHWLQDGDFAGMRGAESLGKLPEAERKEWQQLWEEVEALRQRASPRPKTTKSVRP
jgi:tetratricopeptide (TPR) repeat protein